MELDNAHAPEHGQLLLVFTSLKAFTLQAVIPKVRNQDNQVHKTLQALLSNRSTIIVI